MACCLPVTSRPSEYQSIEGGKLVLIIVEL